MMKTARKNRLITLTLAALVVAGGVVAAPQAATAYTQTTTCSASRAPGPCSIYVNAKKDVRFRVATPVFQSTHRYTVYTPSGRLLCKGSIKANRQTVSCWLGTYTGRVKITVEHRLANAEKIIVLR